MTVQSEPNISTVVDSGLRCLFQPVVELDSAAVIGYEALVRGPAGSSLERPDQLFDEARRLGELHRLDWAARETAVDAARAAGMRLPLSLFVNAEPDALGYPGEDEHWRSFGDLRCYTEITERALMHRPAELLRSIDRIREQDWGIALDDIGAVPESLAIMPLLRPDVLKLDMRALARRPSRVTSMLVHAVMTQAAQTGATVVAEGIEDERQLDLARGYGVQFGQGYYLGRPAELPDPIVTPSSSVPLLNRVTDKSLAPTPFAALIGALTTRKLTQETLLELLRQLLGQAAALTPAPIVLLQLPAGQGLTPELLRALAALAKRCPSVAVLGGDEALAALPGVRRGSLAQPDEDPVASQPEDFVAAVVSPFYAAALGGRPVPHTASDEGPDCFDAVLSFDRATAVRVATLLFTRLG